MKIFKPLLSITLCALIAAESAQALPYDVSPVAPLYQISLPAALGYISDTYSPPSASARATAGKPNMIFIQDLHVNRSVQFAISGILKRLKAQGMMPDRIAVEGEMGPVDIASMQRYPDPILRKKAADYLVQQGEMPGAMHFAVSEGSGGLFGIETDEYYQSNLDMFRRSYKERAALRRDIEKIEAVLPKFKNAAATRDNAALLEKDIQAVSRLINNQVIPEELSSTLRQAAAAIDRLKLVLPEKTAKELTEPLAASVNFYALALLRNDELFKNALAVRALGRQKTTIVVTGGFHTQALTEECKRHGLSYAVITPHIKRHTNADEKLYIERLFDRHLTPDQVRTGRDWAASSAKEEEPAAATVQAIFRPGYLWAASIWTAARGWRFRLKETVAVGALAAACVVGASCGGNGYSHSDLSITQGAEARPAKPVSWFGKIFNFSYPAVSAQEQEGAGSEQGAAPAVPSRRVEVLQQKPLPSEGKTVWSYTRWGLINGDFFKAGPETQAAFTITPTEHGEEFQHFEIRIWPMSPKTKPTPVTVRGKRLATGWTLSFPDEASPASQLVMNRTKILNVQGVGTGSENEVTFYLPMEVLREAFNMPVGPAGLSVYVETGNKNSLDTRQSLNTKNIPSVAAVTSFKFVKPVENEAARTRPTFSFGRLSFWGLMAVLSTPLAAFGQEVGTSSPMVMNFDWHHIAIMAVVGIFVFFVIVSLSSQRSLVDGPTNTVRVLITALVGGLLTALLGLAWWSPFKYVPGVPSQQPPASTTPAQPDRSQAPAAVAPGQEPVTAPQSTPPDIAAAEAQVTEQSKETSAAPTPVAATPRKAPQPPLEIPDQPSLFNENVKKVDTDNSTGPGNFRTKRWDFPGIDFLVVKLDGTQTWGKDLFFSVGGNGITPQRGPDGTFILDTRTFKQPGALVVTTIANRVAVHAYQRTSPSVLPRTLPVILLAVAGLTLLGSGNALAAGLSMEGISTSVSEPVVGWLGLGRLADIAGFAAMGFLFSWQAWRARGEELRRVANRVRSDLNRYGRETRLTAEEIFDRFAGSAEDIKDAVVGFATREKIKQMAQQAARQAVVLSNA